MSISQVLAHLYISDCGLAGSRTTLVKYGIRRIVSVTHRDYDLPPNELCEQLGIRTKVFPIADTHFTDDEGVLTGEIFPWVREAEENGEAVLVHCQAGMSRSPSFVVAYLVWKEMNPSEAIQLVLGKHPDASPWLNTMESFLHCVGASVPEKHKDKADPLGKVKRAE